MKHSIADIKALRERFGGGMGDAKRALDDAGGDLELGARVLSARLIEARRREAAAALDPDWEEIAGRVRARFSEAEDASALWLVWAPELALLSELPVCDELEALVGTIEAHLEDLAFAFERQACPPYRRWFLEGVDDPRLRLFRSLSLGSKDHDVLAFGLPYLDALGQRLEALSVQIDRPHVAPLAALDLPGVRSLGLSMFRPLDLSPLVSSSWPRSLTTLELHGVWQNEMTLASLRPLMEACEGLREVSLGAFMFTDALDLSFLEGVEEVRVRRASFDGPLTLPASARRVWLDQSLFDQDAIASLAASGVESVHVTGSMEEKGGGWMQRESLVGFWEDTRGRRRRARKLRPEVLGERFVWEAHP